MPCVVTMRSYVRRSKRTTATSSRRSATHSVRHSRDRRTRSQRSSPRNARSSPRIFPRSRAFAFEPAIHTGTSDERGGDYYGPAVNRVARLLAIGHGGQTLVSGVTTDLVQGLMPRGATLHDLGQHRLKDLAYPEQVYQLLAPELEREFPPLRSLDVLANNLPRQVTPLIGREREVAEICALLETAPLVTLVGSGGVGKTRASLQVAANLVDGSGDGVWFVELAPIVGC